jgi:hypothetical protein
MIRRGKELSMNATTGTTTMIPFTSHSGRELGSAAKRPAIKPDGEAIPQLGYRRAPLLAQLPQPARAGGQT